MAIPLAPGWLREMPIAHRGLHDTAGGAPENSLAAFAAAVARGYAIELDVRPSADGRAMVFHDQDLQRLTGAPGPLAARPAAELRRLRLLGSDEHVPELSEVLALVGGRVPLLIELKRQPRPGRLEAAVLPLLRDYQGAYAVQSFDPRSMHWFARRAPHIPRGQLAGDRRSYVVAWPDWRVALHRRLLFNAYSQPSFIGYDIDALPYWAPLRARRRGLPLLAWTVRTAEQLAKARRLADNIIFEALTP